MKTLRIYSSVLAACCTLAGFAAAQGARIAPPVAQPGANYSTPTYSTPATRVPVYGTPAYGSSVTKVPAAQSPAFLPVGVSSSGTTVPRVATLTYQNADPKATPVVVDSSCSSGCGTSCGSCGYSCNPCKITWLKPWKCEDLEMKPVERKCHTCCDPCGGGLLRSLLWCPKEEEKKDEEKKDDDKKDEKNGNGKDEKKNGDAKNGNGDAKNGNGDAKKDDAKKDEEKKDEEKKDEEPEDDPAPLMAWIKCVDPCRYQRMKDNGINFYGFVQGGFTANFDSPRDRLNYGTNFNNRSNDVLLNQLYFILEKPLDLDKKKDCFHMGFRVDFMFGHDSPYFENTGLGLFQDFLGDKNEASRLTEMGIGMWNFYADFHLPILTDRGVDIRAGRFISLMGHDASLGNATLFYSRPYEFFYGVPFTNFGALATVHIADTLDVVNGIVRGYEVVFQDNNDRYSYTGALIWNSCDKNTNATLSWITGPEQAGNNHNNRTLVGAYFTHKFGCKNEWKVVGSTIVGWEQNAAVDLNTGAARSGEWYGAVGSLFYTIDPRLTYGIRGEWFHDDDGVRTGFANGDNGGSTWNRPGFAGSFYAVTLGAAYRPYQNLTIRPELRFDWFNGIDATGGNARPYNDRRDNFQTTAGFDIIWSF